MKIVLHASNITGKSLTVKHRRFLSYLTVSSVIATTTTGVSSASWLTTTGNHKGIQVPTFIPTRTYNRLNRSYRNGNSIVPKAIESLISIDRTIQLSSTSGAAEMSEQHQVQKHVLVPIADGSEEIETTCITDTLTRFGAKVVIASVKANNELVCTMSRGIKVMADCMIEECVPTDADTDAGKWDMIVLPGGMPGAEHLRDCVPLKNLIASHTIQQQKPVAAICAAPAIVFAANDKKGDSLLQKLKSSSASRSAPIIATCYPAPHFRQMLTDCGCVVSDESVVVSLNQLLITSQGPATALEFSLKLGELLYGKEKKTEIANAMLVPMK